MRSKKQRADASDTKLARRAVYCFIGFLATLPVVLWGAYQALSDMNDDAISWTAKDLEARRQLEWFDEHFAGGDSIVVSWSGCTIDDPRLAAFDRALSVQDELGRNKHTWLERVVTGSEMLGEMTTEPWNLSRRKAIKRLQGTLVGSDGRTSCAVVVLSDQIAGKGRFVLDTIRRTAQTDCRIDSRDLHLAGHLIETAAINEASLNTLYWLSIPSALLVILVAWPFLKSLRLALLVLATAGFCEACSLASVYYSGRQMNGMLAVMPMLLLVIFVSGAVHLINYYRDSIHLVGPAQAPLRALRMGWFPCCLAVGTTAIGVGSLSLSQVQPIHLFGVYSALGMLLALAVLLAVLPGSLILTARTKSSSNRQPASTDNPTSPKWQRLASAIERHRVTVLIVSGLIMLSGVLGTSQLKGSLQMSDFFSLESRVMRDHAWLEEHLGPLLPVEIVLLVEPECPMSMVDKLQLIERIEQEIGNMPLKAETVSLAGFIPRVGWSSPALETAQSVIFNIHLSRKRDELIDNSHYFVVDGERELWRITTRLESLGPKRYEQLLADLQTAVQRVLDREPVDRMIGVSPVYTGMLPLLAESHPALMRDLIVSFSASFVLIAIGLSMALKSVRLGMVSMLPNLFPIVVVFGGMGMMGRSIDPGTMMTASVGLGIAVDGTVHFLTWFTRGIREGMARSEAILSAYRHCGGAILRTTAICGVGLVVYCFSSFAPAARFGWIVTLLLIAAVIGDLVFLPALLGGRLGQFLVPDER